MNSNNMKQYQDLKKQTYVDDMEVGGGGVGNKTIVLDKFFHDVENVKDDMLVVQKLYEKVQELHEENKMVQNTQQLNLLRSKMDSDFTCLLKSTKIIKGKLEALDKSIVEHQKIPGCGPHSTIYQTRISVFTGLGKKLKIMMYDFKELGDKVHDEHKEAIGRRYFSITGEKANDDLILNLLFTEYNKDFLQQAIQDQGRRQIMDTIFEIQERHDAFIEFKKNLNDLHQFFLDMVVLVEAQGQQPDDIENQVAHASSFIRLGTDQIVGATKLRRRWRKCACMTVILVLIAIVILVMYFIILPTYAGN